MAATSNHFNETRKLLTYSQKTFALMLLLNFLQTFLAPILIHLRNSLIVSYIRFHDTSAF